MLYENTKFADRPLAALIASKLYFQLGDMDESLNYASVAGDYFNISETSEFVETIAFKCIDAYTEQRQKAEKAVAKESKVSQNQNSPSDERMEKLVERMLYQSLKEGK